MTLRSRAESAKKTDAAPLAPEQQTVLQAIYDHFRRTGTWPTFITIDRPIRRDHGWNTTAIVLSLPESVIVPPRQGMPPVPTDELRLRLPGIHSCDGSSDDTERFVRVLRRVAEQEIAYQPPAGSDGTPQITSMEIAQFLGLREDDHLSLERLYAMLDLDHWGLGGRSRLDPSGWLVRLTPDVWRFRNVQSVEDCIRVREDWLAESPSNTWTNAADATPWQGDQTVPADSPYVNGQVADAIRAKQGQNSFDVTKLLGLIDELNDNYASRNTYASHALLRAILDHIPPILGCADFAAVANNYAWGKTDKRYIKRLAAFRDQADDALHRQISPKPDVLDFDDMPSSVCIDRLLQECADKL